MTSQSSVNSSHAALGSVVWVVLVAAFGGFLFGFDTSVINGAVEPIRQTFDLGELMTGFVVSSALLGCVFGAIGGGRISDSIGRQRAMVLAAALFFLSAIGSGLVISEWDLIFWRVLGGLGVGMASVIAPAYIAEVSPAAWRGRLGSVFQLAIVLGIFGAAISNAFLASIAGGADEPLLFGLDAWRWMFITEAIPALVYGLLALSIPESPRFLVGRGRLPEARKVLREVVGITEDSALSTKISDIQRTINVEARQRLKDLVSNGKVMPIVWIGIALAIFQQFVGINVIFYYSSTLWQAVGIAEDQALLVQVITTTVNILATIIGILIVDRVGRRVPLLVGSAGMALGLGMMAVAFSQADISETINQFGEAEQAVSLPGAWAPIALVSANVFVLFFGATWGPFMWVMLGEMFPNRIRAIALGVASAFNWGSNFVISSIFPSMADFSLVFSYSFYAISALLSLVFVWLWVPETKGREIEDMQEAGYQRKRKLNE